MFWCSLKSCCISLVLSYALFSVMVKHKWGMQTIFFRQFLICTIEEQNLAENLKIIVFGGTLGTRFLQVCAKKNYERKTKQPGVQIYVNFKNSQYTAVSIQQLGSVNCGYLTLFNLNWPSHFIMQFLSSQKILCKSQESSQTNFLFTSKFRLVLLS